MVTGDPWFVFRAAVLCPGQDNGSGDFTVVLSVCVRSQTEVCFRAAVLWFCSVHFSTVADVDLSRFFFFCFFGHTSEGRIILINHD